MDFVRTSYERASDGSHDQEIATYHTAGDFVVVVSRVREQLANAGWKSLHQSDSGSGVREVVIDDWRLAEGEAELRFYPVRSGGTDIRVRVTSYKVAVSAAPAGPPIAASSAAARAGDVPAPASTAAIVVVPDLNGQTLHQAGQALDVAGLTMAIAPAKSSEGRPVHADTVAEQDPRAGVRAARGSTVTVSAWYATVRVPDVSRQPFADGVQTLNRAGGPAGGHRLEVQEGTGVPSSNPSLIGRVAGQSPAAGTLVPEKATITVNVFVATGSMPNLVGRLYNDALGSLAQLAHGPGGRRFQVKDGPPMPAADSRMIGKVAEQTPAAGDPAPDGCTVTLRRWVATGPMPNVVGRTFSEARGILDHLANAPGGHSRRLQIQQGPGRPATNPSLIGKVAEQVPAAGDSAPDGSTVTLTLWVATQPLPNLVGKTFEQAKAAMGNLSRGGPGVAGFQVQRGASLPTVDGRLAGTVAAQDPAAGTIVGDGSTVTLTLWMMTGPMPNLVGRSYAAALGELEQLAHAPGGNGRHYLVQQGEPKPTQDYRQDGFVAEQIPAAREPTPDGSTVTLTVYRLGPP